jgi:type IV pilus assembly protein PilQ
MRRALASALLAFALLAATPAITIDVHDADISDVLALLATESGANIVADGSLKPQRITLHLHDVDFEQALNVLVRSHALQVRREGTVLIVGDADAMNRRYDGPNSTLGAQTTVLALAHAKPDDVAKELTDALPEGTVILSDKRTSSVVVTGDANTVARARHLVGALDGPSFGSGNGAVTKSYHLRYVRAVDAIGQLKSLAPDGTFISDPEQNAILVSGNDELQSEAADFFSSVDKPSPQVLFEVKVADVTPLNDSSNVGLEFGGADLQGNPIGGGTAYAFTKGIVPVNVRLNALITQGRAQILATPKLVTLNNKEADLLIGETYPIVFNTSVLGGQNVQFVDIGVKLRLTPTIGPDGVVTAELHPEYSELLGFTQTGYPIIANRKIDSTLRVADSQTIVLGGLVRDVSNQTVEKVPGLSEIPVLGKFFQNRRSAHERDEIVFLITPHVIFPQSPPPAK